MIALLPLLLLFVCTLARAQTSVPVLEVTAWKPCEAGDNNTQQTLYPITCDVFQQFTRVQLQGTVEFSGASFNETVLDSAWTCVGPANDPVTRSLNPTEGVCVPVPRDTRMRVRLFRPHYGYRLTPVGRVPFGYITLPYTNADNSSLALTDPSLLNATALNQTCGGLADVQFNVNMGCQAAIPPYLNGSYMVNSGVCGDPAYQYTPLVELGVVADPDLQALNQNSCNLGALCYPCNASADPVLQTRPVAYQTWAFGPMCDAYSITSVPQLIVDAYVNVTVGGVVRNGVYMSNVYNDNEAATRVSPRGSTLRLTVSDQAQEQQLQAVQLQGYIVVCADRTANSTRQPGVLGGFNWLYNTSGYMPTFQWNKLVYPGLDGFNNATDAQSMQGMWAYFTLDQYVARFQQSTEPPLACGMSQSSQVGAEVPTEPYYSDQQSVAASCALPQYNASLWANTTTNDTQVFFSQMPPWQGACAPGLDVRFLDATDVTMCQVSTSMNRFNQLYASGALPADARPPFLPEAYDLQHPNYFLNQPDQGGLYLMYTPPNMGQGIVLEYLMQVDVSTDLVPYLDRDSTFVAVGSGLQSPSMCEYNMLLEAGFVRLQVCNLGQSRRVLLDIAVHDCDPWVEFAPQAQQGASADNQRWSITNASYANYTQLLLDNPSGLTTPCAVTAPLLFNLTQVGRRELGNTRGRVLQPCTITLTSTVTLAQVDPDTLENRTNTVVRRVNQSCTANNLGRPLPEQPMGDQGPSTSAWEAAGFVAAVVGAAAVGLLAIALTIYGLHVFNESQKAKRVAPGVPAVKYDAIK